MKYKSLKALTILGAIVSLTACQNSNAISTEGVKLLKEPAPSKVFDYKTYEKDANYLSFKSKMQSFSNRLSEVFVKDQYNPNKNIIVSPLSIEMCLGLATYAANGTTRQELLNALDVDYNQLNDCYKLFFEQFNVTNYSNTGDLASQLLLTNSIWIDNDVEYIDKGLNDLRDNYYCYSYEADFDGHNKESNNAIKEFINEKTKGLINPDINLAPEILFVLMNTLYLKDVWNEAGSELSFSQNPYFFKEGNGNAEQTKLLIGNYDSGKAIENGDFSSFHVSTNHGYKLYFIKPNEGKSVSQVFNKENIAYIFDSQNYVKVDEEKKEEYFTRCLFPEYKADSDLDLKKLFIDNFNVKSLFDKNGSLTNVCKTPAYVRDFRHIAKLEVDKKGIEGAAVTYMAYAGEAAPLYTKVYNDFILDKEFGFVLTNRYNDVLFSGVVSNIDPTRQLLNLIDNDMIEPLQ